jgi:hypothetical protein
MLSRSDLLEAHGSRLVATWKAERTFDLRRGWGAAPAQKP